MRRVGPTPATKALEADILALASSTRSARTRTPARAASACRSSASGPGGSGCERRKSGTISTGATTVNSNSTAIEPIVTGTHQPCGHSRRAATTPQRAGGAITALIARALAWSPNQPGRRWCESPARRAARSPSSANGRPASQSAAIARPGVDGRVEHERARRGERARDAGAARSMAASASGASTARRSAPAPPARAPVGPRLGLAQGIVAAGGDGSVVARIDRNHGRSLGRLQAGSSSPSQ